MYMHMYAYVREYHIVGMFSYLQAYMHEDANILRHERGLGLFVHIPSACVVKINVL